MSTEPLAATSQNPTAAGETHPFTIDRRTLLRAGLVGVGGLFLGSGLAACSSGSSSTASASASLTPRKGGTLVYATSLMTSTDSMDPALGENDGIYLLQGAIREGICYLDQNYQVQPRLCTWQANADYTQYTLKVRSGVKFHDGTALTAHDIAWMITRNLDAALGSSLQAPLSADLDADGVKVLDDATLELSLKRSDSALMVQFARAAALIVPKGSDFAKGIGTGPFTLKSYQPGKGFSVVRNENYWMAGLPYLDGVTGLQVDEASTALQGVLSGGTDVTEISYTSVPLLKSAAGAQQIIFKNAALLSIVMDQTKEPFTDVRVRNAMKWAVDREKLVQGAYAGYGQVSADVGIAPDDAQYPSGMEQYTKQDLAKAKSLLAQAGHPDGVKLTLETSNDEQHANFALAFASAVKGSGFEITVHQNDSDTYWDKIWENTPFMVNDWNRRPPVILLPLMFGKGQAWNDSKFSDDEFEAAMAKAAAGTGDAQTSAIHEAASRVLAESGYVIPAWRHRVIAAKKRTQALAYDSSTTFDLRRTWLSS